MKVLVVFFICVSFVVAQQDLEIFQNYTKWTEFLIRNIENNKLSDACASQFQELIANNKQDLWNLFDSTSKFPYSGLSVTTTINYGNYDQCMNINYAYSGGVIKGKYCLCGLFLPTSLSVLEKPNPGSDGFYKLSVCMPNACTIDEFKAIIPLFLMDECQTKDDYENYTNGEIAMLAVLIVIATLMVISTIYDVYLKKHQKKSAHPLYLAFSVYTNGRKILQTSKGNKEQIQIFNGIKTISMAWIVTGHAMIGWNNFIVVNNDVYSVKGLDITIFYVTASHLAVDTFFYMSGFLLAYIYIKQKSKPLMLQIKSLPYVIVHRYFRLTPAVAAMYFFILTLFRHMGSGPMWILGYQSVVKPCHTHWLSFFLYGQNYVNYEDMCFIPTWYLSADMQLFLITTIILIPLTVLLGKGSNKLKMVMGICMILNLFLTLLPLATKLIWTDYINEYDTHSRLIDYMIGITMGIFIRETKDKPFFFNKIKKLTMANLLIWSITLCYMMVICILYQEIAWTHKYSQTAESFYYSLSRPAWCIGLSWMVYSCYHGYGGIVNWILTRPTLQITAKLSYCLYLLHGLVISQSILTVKTERYYDQYTCFKDWWAVFMISLIAAFIWSLAFESPLIIIEKLIFGGGAPKRQHKNKKQSQIEQPQVHEEYKTKGNV